jgi:NAD(P)-dependent dehydrogenase (short-subunit alcohol dehydrogenase family)
VGQARGARINTISPGITITLLAEDKLSGPLGEAYRRMIKLSPMGRAGTRDEVPSVAAFLMGPEGTFITGKRIPHGWRRDGGIGLAESAV